VADAVGSTSAVAVLRERLVLRQVHDELRECQGRSGSGMGTATLDKDQVPPARRRAARWEESNRNR
jgi:hypothetical protein